MKIRGKLKLGIVSLVLPVLQVCGESDSRSLEFLNPTTRIVNGKRATEYLSFGFSAGPLLCGGTLIHDDIFLTAAHCTDVFLDGVILGGTTIDGSDKRVQVSVDAEIPHAGYSTVTHVNDIMLVKLSNRVTALPFQLLSVLNTEPQTNDIVTAMGYGLTSEGGDMSFYLQDVELDVYDFQDCNTLYGGTLFEEMQFCTYTATKDTCQGDSGGPLLDVNGVQVGIVSFGSGCARQGTPAVSIRVGDYESWIKSGICEHSDYPANFCVPTKSPSRAPTKAVTNSPTKSPTSRPTSRPNPSPTMAPFKATTSAPTKRSVFITDSPTQSLTSQPSKIPTRLPTTVAPTSKPPTQLPTTGPTFAPSTTRPTDSPTIRPTTNATTDPPTLAPTSHPPTLAPTRDPPTLAPTTHRPTPTPTTHQPTPTPTTPDPTSAPTRNPTLAPTTQKPTPSTIPPTPKPSVPPTRAPTRSPTKSPVRPPTKSPVAIRRPSSEKAEKKSTKKEKKEKQQPAPTRQPFWSSFWFFFRDFFLSLFK